MADLYKSGKYRLITEDGEEYHTHDELLRTGRIELVRDFCTAYGRGVRSGLILGRTIVTFSDKHLLQSQRDRNMFAELKHEQLVNPLQFFAPSGDGGVGFINDLSNKIVMLVAANRAGKSTSMLVKLLLSMCSCDKTWPIFTEHGVSFRMAKEGVAGLASYKWEHIQQVLAPEILKWIPLSESEELVPEWRGGQGRRRSWDKVSTLLLPNGSGFRAHAYNQDQTSYESAALRDWFWDEQPPRARWEGANERIRTYLSAQHNHGLTPHRVEGMEEFTGSGTFLQKIWEGSDLMGYSEDQVGRYRIRRMDDAYDVMDLREADKMLASLRAGESMPGGDVPDWVFPVKSNIEAYEQHIVAPLRNMNRVARSAGGSRTFGGFESYDALIVPEYDPGVHRIDPFPVPYANATLYRYFDHGRIKPSACLWGFVPRPGWTMKIGDRFITFPKEPIVIFYREYYEPNLTITQHAKRVVEASGNRHVRDGISNVQGVRHERFKELFTKERYHLCKGDTGSLAKPVGDSSMTIQERYAIAGLRMQKTTRRHLHRQGGGGAIDIMRDWFLVDYSRPHLFTPDTMGYTRVYFFSGLVNSHREFRSVIDPSSGGRREQDDHLVQTCMYLLGDSPVYREGSSNVGGDEDSDVDKTDKKPHVRRDPYTGYVC